MELRPFKVSEITQYIKRILIGDPLLYDVNIEGEVSNFKYHYNGNMYFTLKDDKSRIRCVFFNNNMDDAPIVLEDGMYVIVNGYISLYERDGTYQLYVRSIRKKGIGELFESFEKLKKKLEAEGLFDSKNKKTINYLPKKIGVATSSTGAAVKDIISVITRRMPSTEIIIYPILVQGEKAPAEICHAIKYFNSREDIDLIIIGRGGGSIEELWAFNDEEVARTIFSSRLPVVSAVGHETDFTIADFVADMRAPTPSAAGELVVPQIDDLNYRLSSNLISLINIFNLSIRTKKNNLGYIYDRLILNNPSNTLNDNRQRLDIILKDLIKAMNQSHSDKKNKLSLLGSKLDSMSPLAVLNRGYSIAVDKSGNIVKSIKEASVDDVLDLTLSDGKIEVKVTQK
ncbi:exodeoxyribonuclease VII large subunit [Proteiniborus sp. MB09-C3]|uniref:exodeoxyribonuclease VII large subunit n=1 Tax=Proteiniborus sp. MB09-C3 TaxID=3050072 RepID=UPI0025526CD4|nr:exodeoxyribonuclease VII large subunit [Proteiniborus sp. MB09-C3]WIV10993.1 exodeoxyribonuclease VII large subunit [Proteiniborus sp. MB09-C3]